MKHLSHSLPSNSPLTPLSLLLFLILLTSCGNKHVIDEEHTFDRNVWNRFSPERFEFNIQNIEDYYHIDVTVAIDTTVYRYHEFPCAITLVTPGGEERSFRTSIALNDKGRWRGEMQDDYRVVTGRVRSYFSFNSKGVQHMDILQNTSQYNLEGIHSIGLNIYKGKIDYSNFD